VLFKCASFVVTIVSWTLLRTRLEHHLLVCQSGILGHLGPAWAVEIYFLSRAFKRPVAHLKTFLALLGALHVLPVAYAMRHFIWMSYFFIDYKLFIKIQLNKSLLGLLFHIKRSSCLLCLSYSSSIASEFSRALGIASSRVGPRGSSSNT